MEECDCYSCECVVPERGRKMQGVMEVGPSYVCLPCDLVPPTLCPFCDEIDNQDDLGPETYSQTYSTTMSIGRKLQGSYSMDADSYATPCVCGECVCPPPQEENAGTPSTRHPTTTTTINQDVPR